jgi:hypothetical protein
MRGRPLLPRQEIIMLTLPVIPASAPVLRLLIATMRDLREQETCPDLAELLGQVRLACAAAGLDKAAVPELMHALRNRTPVCIVAREQDQAARQEQAAGRIAAALTAADTETEYHYTALAELATVVRAELPRLLPPAAKTRR